MDSLLFLLFSYFIKIVCVCVCMYVYIYFFYFFIPANYYLKIP